MKLLDFYNKMARKGGGKEVSDLSDINEKDQEYHFSTNFHVGDVDSVEFKIDKRRYNFKICPVFEEKGSFELVCYDKNLHFEDWSIEFNNLKKESFQQAAKVINFLIENIDEYNDKDNPFENWSDIKITKFKDIIKNKKQTDNKLKEELKKVKSEKQEKEEEAIKNEARADAYEKLFDDHRDINLKK